MAKSGGNRVRRPTIDSAMPLWANGRRNRLPRRPVAWRTWLGIALLIGAVAVYAILPEAPFSPDGPALTGSVERVADGDTIEIAGQRIRLLGLDAPETKQTCGTAAGGSWECGRIAAERMRELTRGRSLSCRPEGHDKYARLLAVCLDGKSDIAEVLVGEGLAVATDRYRAAEAGARAGKRGVWQGAFVTPAEWRRKAAEGEAESAGNPSRFERFVAWLLGLFPS